jgi:DNA (cytosine-5)-methyltransferase 1
MARFGFVDLFSGIGGFHHALRSLGGECVLAVERDEECRKVYRESFGPRFDDESIFARDIRSITTDGFGNDATASQIKKRVPEHEILCAGFPCQPFSKSGAQLGTRDQARGTLFYDIMSIVEARKPKVVILENVRNIAGPRHVDTWRTIINSLRSAGYMVSEIPLVLSPHRLHPDDGGSPQVRDRVFICAVKRSRGRTPLPLSRDHLDLRPWDPDSWVFESILDEDRSIPDISRYRVDESQRAAIDAWQWFVQNIEDDELPGFPIWAGEFGSSSEYKNIPSWKQSFIDRNRSFYVDSKLRRKTLDSWLQKSWGPHGQQVRVRDFPASRQKFEWQARKAQPTRSTRDLTKLLLQFRPSGIRVKPATYAPALVAITQTTIVGSRMRKITPNEAARLQGIVHPTFELAGVSDAVAYRQLGNAVNVGVVRVIAEPLLPLAGIL